MPVATIQELALRVRDGQARDGGRPRFAIFLGAGASIESGIPGTERMMRTFREKLQERWEAEGAEGEFDEWLEGHPNWDKKASDYSNLFEVYEPTERGRARHIEGLVANRKPSWGYVGLAQLLARGYLDTVITTNFDDLVYEACASWTEVRPRVYSHGTVSGPIRQEQGRPTILKLHGDFLYSRLKNTDAELGQADPNLGSAVRRLLDDHEFIVIGYGGNDRSVMQLLNALPDEAGLYWCTYGNEGVGRLAQRLIKRPNAFTVRPNGFDGFMDELLHTVGFTLPEVDRAVRRQRDTLIDLITQSDSPYTADYLAQSQESIRAQKLTDTSSEREATQRNVRAYLEVHRQRDRGDFEGAIATMRRELEAAPNDVWLLSELGTYLGIMGETEESIEVLRRVTEIEPSREVALQALGSQLTISGKLEEAIEVLERALTVSTTAFALRDMGLALLAKGRGDQAREYLQRALDNGDSMLRPTSVYASVVTALGRRDEGLGIIRQAVQDSSMSPLELWRTRAAFRRLQHLGVEGSEQAIALLEEALEQIRERSPRGDDG